MFDYSFAYCNEKDDLDTLLKTLWNLWLSSSCKSLSPPPTGEVNDLPNTARSWSMAKAAGTQHYLPKDGNLLMGGHGPQVASSFGTWVYLLE